MNKKNVRQRFPLCTVDNFSDFSSEKKIYPTDERKRNLFPTTHIEYHCFFYDLLILEKRKSKSRLLFFFLNTLYLCIAFSQYYLTTQLCITYLFKEEKTNMKSKLLVVLCEQNTYLLLVMTIKMRYTRVQK